jgi:hypothetical protein
MKLKELKQLIKEIHNSQNKCGCGCNKCAIKSDSDLINNFVGEQRQSILKNKNAPINKNINEVLSHNIKQYKKEQ